MTDDEIMHVVSYSTVGSNAIAPTEWCAFARALLAASTSANAGHASLMGIVADGDGNILNATVKYREVETFMAPIAETSSNVAQGAEPVRDSRGEQVRLMQWHGGAGLLWDVYAFGKWSKRIVSPIEWDAHTVYLDMVRAGYAEHIELRLVSSSNNADHDEPNLAPPAPPALTDAEGKRLPSLEEIQNLRDHGHGEEAAWWLERRNAALTAARSGDES